MQVRRICIVRRGRAAACYWAESYITVFKIRAAPCVRATILTAPWIRIVLSGDHLGIPKQFDPLWLAHVRIRNGHRHQGP